MRTLDDLAELLHGIDQRGYGAYKEAKGAWEADGFTLHVDWVQGDPYATPSKLRVRLPPGSHRVPDAAWSNRPRRVGLCDYLLRRFREACDRLPGVPGSGRSGLVLVSVDSPRVVERAGCRITDEGLELRFRVGLPAGGRSCYGHSAAELLTEHLPRAVRAVRWPEVDRARAREWIHTVEDHAHVQARLADLGLVGFIRDGSVLPRESGVSSAPLPEAVPFEAPEGLRVEIATPNHGDVAGLGVPRGVTVITGGGFHGKTTVLEALQAGVVPHVPGDGREWTVTAPDALKVRSEEGRSVAGVDLRPFVRDLPLGRETASFSTPDASGSTSLAAAILEALEMGSSLLLMDEDTCATNLMVRDARMQELVREETITPLIDRVRELLDRGVSTVLVTGGSGDYLDVADTVILMEGYRPLDVTSAAREVVETHPSRRETGRPEGPLEPPARAPRPGSFDPRRGSGKPKVRTRGTHTIQYGDGDLDISAVEQLTDYGEARAVGEMLRVIHGLCDGRASVAELAREVVARARDEGLAALRDDPELALPRPHEVAQAMNRLRSLEVVPAAGPEGGDGSGDPP